MIPDATAADLARDAEADYNDGYYPHYLSGCYMRRAEHERKAKEHESKRAEAAEQRLAATEKIDAEYCRMNMELQEENAVMFAAKEAAERKRDEAQQLCLDLSIKRVQTHGTAHCLYCGFTGERKLFAEAKAETLEHGRTCDKHPMRAIERDNAELRKLLERAEGRLRLQSHNGQLLADINAALAKGAG